MKYSMKNIRTNIVEILKMIQSASKFRIPLIVLKSFLDALPSLINIFIMKFVLDMGTSGSSWVKVIWVISAALLLYFIVAAYNAWFNQKYRVHSDLKIKEYLEGMMYSKIREIDVEAYDNTEFYSSYVKAVNEINSRAMGVLGTLSTMLCNIISLIGVASFIIYLRWELILFVIIYILLSTLLSNRKLKVVYRADIAQVDTTRKIGYVGRLFYLKDYLKDLKVFNLYDFFINRFKRDIKTLHAVKSEYENKLTLYDLAQNMLQVVFVLAMIAFLGIELILRQITAGSFAGLLNSAQSLGYAVQQMFTFFPDMVLHSKYIDNINEFLNYRTKIELINQGEKVKRGEHIISLRNVCYKYDGASNNTIKDICLDIKTGESLAIVGYNGAGKTTLIKNIIRLYDPTEGELTIDGLNYKDYDICSLRSSMGVVFQDFTVFAVSIAENILLRASQTAADEELVWNALRISGLDKKVESLPDGIHSILTKEFDENGVVLSGGEVQKLAVARAVAQDYDILIFDEPTSALDPISEYELLNKIREISKGKILIIISHRLYAIQSMDRIVYLENGSIAEYGNHESLIKQNGKYAAMYLAQSGDKNNAV